MSPPAQRRQISFSWTSLTLATSSRGSPKKFLSSVQSTNRPILRLENVSCTTVLETTLVWPLPRGTRSPSTPEGRFTSLTISRNTERPLERVPGTALSRWLTSSETRKSRSASSRQRLRVVRVFFPQLSRRRYRLIGLW